MGCFEKILSIKIKVDFIKAPEKSDLSISTNLFKNKHYGPQSIYTGTKNSGAG
ncbi:hypothetical protein CYANOKiyG1_53960 [Okeania sp. KiyG1]|nr:hypothetical protein CYANOKiyG1_53960 [Okeania sp. KiyG1]